MCSNIVSLDDLLRSNHSFLFFYNYEVSLGWVVISVNRMQ